MTISHRNKQEKEAQDMDKEYVAHSHFEFFLLDPRDV